MTQTICFTSISSPPAPSSQPHSVQSSPINYSPSFSPPFYVPPKDQNSNKFVEEHNNYRNNVNPKASNMTQLTWSDDLANSASNWAKQCHWKHSNTPGLGENLYATTNRTNFNPIDAIDSWGNEKFCYNYNTNSCSPSCDTCGHYTQMVWANSNKIGCAVQDCPSINGLNWRNGGTMVVCQYSPPGNYIGQKPYRAN